MLRRSPSLLLVSALLFEAGCTTDPSRVTVHPEQQVDQAQYSIRADTGRVAYRVAIPPSYGQSRTTTVPMFIGAAVVPLRLEGRAPVTVAAYYLYYIAVGPRGTEPVRVASRGDIPDGTCVDVLVKEQRPGVTSYPVGEAALRASNGCQ